MLTRSSFLKMEKWSCYCRQRLNKLSAYLTCLQFRQTTAKINFLPALTLLRDTTLKEEQTHLLINMF